MKSTSRVGNYKAHHVKSLTVPKSANLQAPSQLRWQLGEEVYESTPELLDRLAETGPEGRPAQFSFRHQMPPLRAPEKLLTGPAELAMEFAAWTVGDPNALPQLAGLRIPSLLRVLTTPLIPLVGMAAPLVYNIPWSIEGAVDGWLIKHGGEEDFLYQSEDDSGRRRIHRVDLKAFGRAVVPRRLSRRQWWSSGAKPEFLNPLPCPPEGLNERYHIERLLAKPAAGDGVDLEEDFLVIGDVPLEIS